MKDKTTWTQADSARLRAELGTIEGREISPSEVRRMLDEIDRLHSVEVAVFASLLLAALEDPDATPEDETRAALDLRRALGGEPIDPLAALEAAERALLVAAKWKSDPEDRWCDPEDGRWCGRAFAVEVERTRREKKAGAL
jgi:hypothetical protein